MSERGNHPRRCLKDSLEVAKVGRPLVGFNQYVINIANVSPAGNGPLAAHISTQSMPCA